jgi:alkylhydroperoxidase/carboxymuconolactone decarboxylase family protein YurZ
LSEGFVATTAAGWARLRAQLDDDGALPALEKTLIVAMVAASRGRAELLRSEAARLNDLGGERMAEPAASLLTIARGRAVADDFARAAGVDLDWSVSGQGWPDEAEVGAALEYFSPSGAVPPPAIDLLGRHAPSFLVGYRPLREGIHQGPLDPRLIELSLFAVSAGDRAGQHAALHATRALEHGAGEAELVEAGLCAVPSAGMAAWMVAAETIADLDQSRPTPIVVPE